MKSGFIHALQNPAGGTVLEKVTILIFHSYSKADNVKCGKFRLI